MRPHALLLLLLAVALARLSAAQEGSPEAEVGKKYPPYDGSRHNAKYPNWGKKNTPFIHMQVPNTAYGNGDTLTGTNRPSARTITLALLHQPYFKATTATNSSAIASGLGQLVSVDVNRAGSSAKGNGGPAPIKVPAGDPFIWRFDNGTPVAQGSRSVLSFFRTNFTRPTPTSRRQQINEATSWLDASCIYGESAEAAQRLKAGTAGRLLMDDDKLLPFNRQQDSDKPKQTMKNLAERVPQTRLRLSGNINVNQNPLVMSVTTVFVREHNRRARLLEAANPDWGDERIFQEARKWVIGHVQKIALVDYLSAIGMALPPYKGYNSSLDPSIDTFFTTVAYRYGHTTINDAVLRLDEAWAEHPRGHLMMAEVFYNPNVALDAGLEALLRGMLAQKKGKVEPRWSLAMAGNFAGHASVNGTDVAAINIQRARDHGVPDYNTCRRAFGLPPAKNFSDITPDEEIAGILQQLYVNVNNIDPYVGGLAEPPANGAHMGPLFAASIKEQFLRLRDADWWYFENGANNKLYSQAEMDEIRTTTMRDLLLRNTNIKDLPTDIWTASNSMTCAAGGSGDMASSSGGDKLVAPGLLGGAASLRVEPGSTPGWAKVHLTSSGSGWLGFGVADIDSASPMIGSDMVIGRMVDGAPEVRRYTASGHQPPSEVSAGQGRRLAANAPTADSRLRNVKFQQTGDQVQVEFERPTDAGDSGKAMPASSPLRLIVARGPSNDISSFNGYHGPSNREIIDLKQGLFGSASTATADPKAIAKRKAHGALMAVNFIVIFPLGALAARQLRCHWIKSPAVRASLFYVHIAAQVGGVACATAGFVIATRWFNVPYDQVQYSHGKMGIAILVLVYSQLIMGFVRPTATAPTSRRHLWDVVHSTIGRAAMLIGLANVGLGIVIFSHTYSGDFGVWAGLCAAGLGALSLLQYLIDRQEKYAVLRNDRDMLLKVRDSDHIDGADVDIDATSTPHKPFPRGNLHLGNHNSEELPPDFDTNADPATAAGYGAAAASPRQQAAAAAAAGSNGGRSPKLTATLLQRHDAAAGVQAAGNGQHPTEVGVLGQPGYAAADAGVHDVPAGHGWDQAAGAAAHEQHPHLPQQQWNGGRHMG